MIAEDMGLTLSRVLSRGDLRTLVPSQGATDIPDRLESEGVFWYELSPESLDVE